MVLCKLPIKKGPGEHKWFQTLEDPVYHRATFTLSVPATPNTRHRHTVPFVVTPVVLTVGINSLTRVDDAEGQTWEFAGEIDVQGPDLPWEHWGRMKVKGSYRTDTSTGEIEFLGEKLPIQMRERKIGPCSDVLLRITTFSLYPPLHVVDKDPEEAFRMAVFFLGEIGFPQNPDAYQLIQ